MGHLSVDAPRRETASGKIGTVVARIVGMPGRLMGARLQARHTVPGPA